MTRPANPEPFGESETAILVAAQLQGISEEEASESLEELEALAHTAGAKVASYIIQKRKHIEPSTLLGRGKIDEIVAEIGAVGAEVVIFDNELSVTQQDRLSEVLETKVVDRTALILDIFAQHAHTKEGRTQVELAQLSYLLPRIRGRGLELSRLGGGIGTRGPGETKLEVDRRRIRRRMQKLEGDLAQMEAVRSTQRKRRDRAGLPSVCLVGYTNSGKSSLLNRLTGSSVATADQLFSTLDSTTRRLTLPSGAGVVLSDTVGFIRKLPHELVAAFRSTLEVVRDADLLLHVVDTTAEEVMDEHITAVNEVLGDLGVLDTPSIMVMNKVDLVGGKPVRFGEARKVDSIFVSALAGDGIDSLLRMIDHDLMDVRLVNLSIPAGRGDVISGIYRDGKVRARDLEGETVLIRANLPADRIDRYRDYITGA